MKQFHEFILYAFARSFSVISSTILFSLLAKSSNTEVIKDIFSLMFIVGFSGSLLRSYCMYSANLSGEERRSEKMHFVFLMSSRYIRLSPLFIFGLVGLLLAQDLNIEPWLVALVAFIIVFAGFDSDQVRAVFGLTARFSNVFALGNICAVFALLTFGDVERTGIFLVLCPWIAVSLLNAFVLFKITHSLKSWSIRSCRLRKGGLGLSAFTVALYDGVVLNLPFMFSGRLSTPVVVDLAVAMRLFSSSLSFFPLINHWVSTGKLYILSDKICCRTTSLYALFLLGSSIASSVVFIIIYSIISQNRVGSVHYSIYLIVLLGITIFSVAVRFYTIKLGDYLNILFTVSLLCIYVLCWFLFSFVLYQQVILVGAMQFLALVTYAVIIFFGGYKKS